MSDWRKVDEAPPNSDEDVLLYRPAIIENGELFPKFDVGSYSGNGLLWDWRWGGQPTHWSYLEAPSDD